MQLLRTISNIIFLVYFLLVFKFTYKLKTNECQKTKKCTQDWRLNYSHYTTFIFVFISILGLIKNLHKLLFSCGQSGGGVAMMATLVLTLLVGALVVNQYSIITLIQDLQKNGCPCDIKYRDFIYYMTIIHFVFCLITYLVALNKISLFSSNSSVFELNNKMNTSSKSSKPSKPSKSSKLNKKK